MTAASSSSSPPDRERESRGQAGERRVARERSETRRAAPGTRKHTHRKASVFSFLLLSCRSHRQHQERTEDGTRRRRRKEKKKRKKESRKERREEKGRERGEGEIASQLDPFEP